jgi:protein arginine N-methyltransferase 1
VSLVLDEHRQYLSDAVRIDAFRRAIHEMVAPGSVVLDLASGTGILGLMACQAGARRVYAIEATGMTEVAKAVARANGFGDRVVTIPGLSSQVTLPEHVDAIVCDQIGHFGFEAGLLEYGSDARDRFLKPGGRFVPSRIDIVVAPVEDAALFDNVQFWLAQPAGFDFSPAHQLAANTGYPKLLTADSLLGPELTACSIDMMNARADAFAFEAPLRVARRGTLHGIGGWFSAQLSPSVTLTNAPTAERRLQRRNVFLPIADAVPVEAGDEVSVRIHVIPPDTVTWSVEITRRGTMLGRCRRSTSNGMLIQREELRRMDPRSIPALTARGIARLTVLTLCDGTTPLASIEREVFRRHADLFQSESAASAFVAEVVTRYSH